MQKLVTWSLLALAVVACGSSSEDSPAAAAPSTDTTPPDTTGATTETPTGNDKGSGGEEWSWTAPVIADASAACSAGAAPDTSKRDYTTASGRTYHVFWPASFDANKKYPVIFAFHGLEAQGMSFEGWFKLEKHLNSANESTNNQAIVVYPDGQKDWDTGSDKDLKFFDEMVAELGASTCFNPQYVYAFGFSWGGYFVDYLSCNRAGYVRAAAIGDSGSLGPYSKCGRVPLIIASRTADQNEQLYKGQKNFSDWTSYLKCGGDKSAADNMNCVDASGCTAPGAVTFCEDTYSFMDHKSDYGSTVTLDWEHTVRPEYQFRAWQFLKAH